MSRARITWISGPVLRAATNGAFRMREAIRVGDGGLLGEVIRIDEREIVAQVYEDTTGLRPGDTVEGSGTLLSIGLGPHLLGGIFDGLLRPLARAGGTPRRHIHPGPAASVETRLHFTPSVRQGERLAPGTGFGRASPLEAAALSDGNGARLERAWIVRVPPDAAGAVQQVAAEGDYAIDAPLLTLRDAESRDRTVAASNEWPVRTPRPVAARLPSDEPLITGQRVLDSLFPVALGGKGAIPGGFGTGKTILLEALAKSCHADVIVYLGCGERGNELAGVLEEFPQLQDPRSGRPLMERTVVIANTSNMPVAAREASIYAAVTVAEYFRDQGLHVALMADSTSRWAEALREVSSRFGELPGEGGYPNYLASRIADFYERAAKVTTLGGDTGSVTLLGSISPPSGDFSEPVTSHTKRYVRCFWALDSKRAQARFYPAVDPLQSYSEDSLDTALWWQDIYGKATAARARKASGENEWSELRRRVLTLLDEQARLERMARIIGKDALPARQRLTLANAELLNEAFLRQSAFSEIDCYCGPERQASMLRLLAHFVEHAAQAQATGASPEQIAALPLHRRLVRMSEEIDERDTEAMRRRFAELEAELESTFDQLSGKRTSDAAVPGETGEAVPSEPRENPQAKAGEAAQGEATVPAEARPEAREASRAT